MNKSNNLVSKINQSIATLFIAISFGAATFYYLVVKLKYWSEGFSGKTDIIGYPIYANYNAHLPLNAYIISMSVCFLLLIFIVYFSSGKEWENLSPIAPFNFLTSLLITSAIRTNGGAKLFLTTVGVLYASQYLMSALLYFRSDGKFGDKFRQTRESLLFTVILLTVPITLFIISNNTGWKDAAGQLTHLIWFPKWALIATELAVLYMAFDFWRKNISLGFAKTIATSYLVIPALIFIVLARVQGTFTMNDIFHSGEYLAPLTLGLSGALPWKDFLFVHGIWNDFSNYYLGAIFWEHSLRGGLEGPGLLLTPLYWVFFYALFLAVFRGNCLKALVSLFVGYTLCSDPFRFPLYPVILFLFYKGFATQKQVWFALFSALTIVEIIISPEFGVIAFGLGFVILAKDTIEHKFNFIKYKSSLICFAVSLIVTAAILLFLSRYDLLDGFLITVFHFSRGHLLTGGIKMAEIDHLFLISTLLIFYIFCTAYFVLARFREHRTITPVLYLMFGLAIDVAIYFFKYFGRPDGHIYHVVAVAVPGISILVVYLLGLGINQLHKTVPAIFLRYSYLAVLLVIMQFGIPGFSTTNWVDGIKSNLENIKDRMSPHSAAIGEPGVWTTGFVLSKDTFVRVEKLQKYFSEKLSLGDTVFDFSDSPGLYYSVLQLKPATRFTHVSMAIRSETQQLLIEDLKKSQPKFVIYQSNGGLGGWDGISNEVRHYLVAAYINRNYVFERELDGALIFRRADILSNGPEYKIPYSEALPPTALLQCSLGFIPDYFVPRTSVSFRPVLLSPPIQQQFVELHGWVAAKEGNDVPEIQILHNSNLVIKFNADLIRPDVDAAYRKKFGLTGFSRISVFQSDNPDYVIQIMNTRTKKISKFGDGDWLGNIDSITSKMVTNIAFNLPDEGVPIYLRLQFNHVNQNANESIMILSSDFPGGKVTFDKVPDSEDLILPLGGCNIWSKIAHSKPVIVMPSQLSIRNLFYSSDKEGGL